MNERSEQNEGDDTLSLAWLDCISTGALRSKARWDGDSKNRGRWGILKEMGKLAFDRGHLKLWKYLIAASKYLKP